MSQSAVDHLKALLAEEALQEAGEALDEASEVVADCRGQLAHVQAALADALTEEESAQDAVRSIHEDVQTATAIRDKKPEKAGEIDPRTGLPPGKNLPITREQATWLGSIMMARKCMEEGDIEEAKRWDRESSELVEGLESYVDARATAVPAFQIRHAHFVEPHGMPSDEEISRTIEYAENDPPDTSTHSMRMMSILAQFGMGAGSSYPDGVNSAIMTEISVQQRQLKKMQEEDESEDEDYSTFEMNETAWKAIDTAIRNRVSYNQSVNPTQLTLPKPSSAPIARYNKSAHFRFKSEQAQSSMAELDDALYSCRLRRRPAEWSLPESGASNAMFVQRPFEIRTNHIVGFDVDGDLMTTCGDLANREIRGCKTYVGFQQVPCAVNLEQAQTLVDLKDASTGNFRPWDENSTKLVYRQSRKKCSRENFTECVADATNERIWASSSNGTVHAFSTAAGMPCRERQVALLAFDAEEIKAQANYVNGSFAIARCGECLVGASGTGRVAVWNMQEAVAEFPFPNNLGVKSRQDKQMKGKEREFLDSDTDDSDGSAEEPDEEDNARKRQKTNPYTGLSPRNLTVEDDGFACGDLQCLGGSQLLIAPLQADDNSKMSTSLRLFDLTAEQVVGIFCGNQGRVSIGKQYCADSHNYIFSMDCCVGMVWDIRTFQPAIALHTGHWGGQILGVPSTSCAAFTYGDDSESVSCWDLRMPGSHAYTMATGNTEVRSLLWHERTSSLLAATRSEHIVTHGTYGAYMYGERLSWEDEEERIDGNLEWPQRAKHEPTYFGDSPWNCDCSHSSVLLQYAFETGRPMGA